MMQTKTRRTHFFESLWIITNCMYIVQYDYLSWMSGSMNALTITKQLNSAQLMSSPTNTHTHEYAQHLFTHTHKRYVALIRDSKYLCVNMTQFIDMMDAKLLRLDSLCCRVTLKWIILAIRIFFFFFFFD